MCFVWVVIEILYSTRSGWHEKLWKTDRNIDRKTLEFILKTTDKDIRKIICFYAVGLNGCFIEYGFSYLLILTAVVTDSLTIPFSKLYSPILLIVNTVMSLFAIFFPAKFHAISAELFATHHSRKYYRCDATNSAYKYKITYNYEPIFLLHIVSK